MQSQPIFMFLYKKFVLVLFRSKRDLHFGCATFVGALFYFGGGGNMAYTYKELQGKTIHAVRVIGKEIGVKSPSTLKKQELIDRILDIQSGKVMPKFSSSGRPRLGSENIVKPKKETAILEKEIDKILEQTKLQILNLISK